MRQLLDYLVQRSVRQVALDVDDALLIHATDSNRAYALFYVGKVAKKDASSACLHGNSAHIFNIIATATGKAYCNIGVIAMVLHIVRQHTGATSTNSGVKGLRYIIDCRMIIFQLVAVHRHLQLRHALYIGIFDILQACSRSKNLLYLGGICHELIHIAALKLHLYRRAHEVATTRNTGNR